MRRIQQRNLSSARLEKASEYIGKVDRSFQSTADMLYDIFRLEKNNSRPNETVEKYRLPLAFLFLSSTFLDFRFVSATFCSDVEAVCAGKPGFGPGLS